MILSLDDNNISTLDPNVFSPLTRLSSLDLSGNKILELSHSMFQFMPQLKDLLLNNNHISSWNASILANNQQSTYIWLDGNQIRNVEINSFTNLRNLVTLRIGDKIETIPALMNPEELKNLTLYHNPIKEVTAASFQKLIGISKIEKELFTGANNLIFRATGNTCGVSSGVTVFNKDQFEKDIVPILNKCLNLAVSSKINALLLTFSSTLAFLMAF